MGLKAENQFVIFWGSLGAIALLVIWHLPWRFQVNDDEVMMWLVSGSYTGTPESYAVFLHPILSWIFSLVYQLAPGIHWYPVAWFIIMLFSYLVLIFQIQTRIPRGIDRHIWALFVFAFFVHFLFFLQFSIVSAFAGTVGFAGRLNLAGEKGKNWFSYQNSDLLILVGFLIRPEVALLFIGGILLLNMLVFRDPSVYMKIFLPGITCMLGILFSHIWITAAGLTEFQRINTLRSQVFDHPVLQLHKDDFKLNEPDLYYFSNGLIDFGNSPDLSEKLSGWKELLNQQRVKKLNPENLFKSLYTYIQHEHFLMGLMGCFLIFSLCLQGKKALQLILILMSVLLLSSPFFLIKVQIYGIIFLFYFLLNFSFLKDYKIVKQISIGFLIVLSTAVGFHFQSFFQSSFNRVPAKNLSLELDRLRNEDIEEIYLVGTGHLYSNLLYDNPGRFKILGWPTLLENHFEGSNFNSSAFLIDSATYFNNIGYFKTEVRQETSTDLILLIRRE